jgi:bacteriorhodopsin
VNGPWTWVVVGFLAVVVYALLVYMERPRRPPHRGEGE